MGHRSTKLLAGALIGLCVIAAIAFYFLRSKPQNALTAERVAFLVTEMTKTAERQQKALDELVVTALRPQARFSADVVEVFSKTALA